MSTRANRGMRAVLASAGALMALVAVVLLLTGGGGDGEPAPEPAPTTGGGSRFQEEARPREATPPDELPAGIEGRVAQVFVGGFANESGPRRVWGGLYVTGENYASPAQLRDLLAGLKERARAERRPVPIVFADPGELGELGPMAAPDVGASGEQALARREARDAALRVRTAGVDAVLAPSADIGSGTGPAADHAFADDPRTVTAFSFQAVDGWLSGNVIAVPGRFPGEGAASQDPIEGPATVGMSLDELMGRDVQPFAGLAPRAPAIQMSAAMFAAWDGVTPATLQPEAVALLRERLGFRGAVVSADLNAAVAQTGEDIGSAAVAALNAGCDLLLVPGGRAEQEAAYAAVLRAVRRGEVPVARLEQARERVAALRRSAGRS